MILILGRISFYINSALTPEGIKAIMLVFYSIYNAIYKKQ